MVAGKPMTRLIKRYGNRKLYDTHTSTYITLHGVATLVREGHDVRVIDNDTGEDLTALVFAQIIVEEQKGKAGFLSLPALRWIIQEGEARIQDILERVDRGREAIDNVRGLAEKGVERFVRRGSGKRAGGLLSDLLEKPQQSLDALQRQIDTQVRRSVKRLAGHPAVQTELARIQNSLHRLERQISRLKGQPAPTPKRSRRATE